MLARKREETAAQVEEDEGKGGRRAGDEEDWQGKQEVGARAGAPRCGCNCANVRNQGGTSSLGALVSSIFWTTLISYLFFTSAAFAAAWCTMEGSRTA